MTTWTYVTPRDSTIRYTLDGRERWIPATERLPEPLGTLVLCFSTVPGGAWAFSFGRYVSAEYGWEKAGMTAAPVTHWMPLPDPPRTREEQLRHNTEALDDMMAAGPYVQPEPSK